MGTRTQQQPMMVPPPEARAIPTDQTWLSETDPVSRTAIGDPNKNSETKLKEVGGFSDRLQRRLIAELDSPNENVRESAMRQLRSADAFQSIFAAVQTGQITQEEFMKLSSALLNNRTDRDPQVTR